QPSQQPKIYWVEVAGVTSFWIAANALDGDAMRLLVASGADPNAKSIENTTPLMVAAGLGSRTRGPSGYIGGPNWATSRRGSANVNGEVLKLLLDWGNDINAANDYGQ